MHTEADAEGVYGLQPSPPPERMASAVHRVVGDRVVYRIGHFGHGKLGVVERSDGAWLKGSSVVLPPPNGAIEREGFAGPSLDWLLPESLRGWRAQQADVRSWMARALGRRGWRLPLSPYTSAPADAAILSTQGVVSFAVWRDGTVVWREESPDGRGRLLVSEIDVGGRKRQLAEWMRGQPELVRLAESRTAEMEPSAEGVREIVLVRAIALSLRLDLVADAETDVESLGRDLRKRLLDWIPRTGGVAAPFDSLEIEGVPGVLR